MIPARRFLYVCPTAIPSNAGHTASRRQIVDSNSQPKPVNDQTNLKGGMKPEAFQRRLVLVTGLVLFLGIVGGTCLGMKIRQAERAAAAAEAAEAAQNDKAPSEQKVDRRRGR